MILNAPLRAWAKFTVILVGCGFSLVSVWRTPGQELRQVSEAPLFGTFWLLSFELDGGQSPPYPFDPYDGTLPIYQMDGFPNHYLVTDSPEDYSALRERRTVKAHGEMNTLDGGEGPPVPGEGGGGGGNGTNSPPVYVLGLGLCLYPPIITASNSLILIITNTPDSGWVTNAHDPFYTTNLASLPAPVLCATNWAYWGRNQPGETNFTFSPLPYPECYFRLGTMQDGDFDGLTTAFERLVSHTSETNPDSPRDVYEGVVSNQTPSAWFKLNDGSLTNAISGQAVTTLTNGGGAWDVDAFAIGNGAFSFTASSHGLMAGDVVSGGTGTNQGSMSFLFRSIDGYSSNTVRYVFYQNSDFGAFFEYTNTTSGYPGSLKVHVGGQTNAILLSNDLVFGAWYYLAMTWDETRDAAPEVAWYLGRVGGTLTNGTIDLTNNRVVGSNTTVYLGNNNAANRAFRGPGFGALDEIAFWNRELSGSEVDAQFSTLKALFQGPSKVFDLTRWELTLPVDNLNQLDNTHDPLDIGTAWLNSGFKYVDPTDSTQKYFYLSTSNTMVFEAPWNGADQDSTSPATNLGSPRSELRETLANGGEFNWKPHDPATGTATNTHTLQATCRLENAPSKVIFGQIHTETPNPPSGGLAAITLFHEGSGTSTKRIRLAVYFSPDGSVTNAGGSKDEIHDLVSGVNLGDLIDYELKLVGTSNSTVTLTATIATNGGTAITNTVPMTLGGFSGWADTNVTLYFKAGCYYPKAATNSGTARVTFSGLGAAHQP